ncbi:MAG: 4a-hydroxytetrahydrobiopterin dehydratase [Lacipirellulaceae bacterium]
MNVHSPDELACKKCLPCEGGVEPCSLEHAKAQLDQLGGWRLTHDGRRIRKDWRVKDFLAAIEFFKACATVAEEDGHHPDLHVEGYRNVSVEIWTHAIGGLSENDFILAAKIDRLPIELTAKNQ